MSSETPPPIGDGSSNPLEQFRSRAALILRENRGMSPQAMMRLTELADELALDDKTVEAELARLHSSGTKPTNPDLEKFRKRLTKDLAGHERTVIGPAIETQIITAAQRKYAIEENEAREVLAEVAQALSLRRVSTNQAIDNFNASIADAAKDASWLARDAWDRLRSAGQSWGLDEELIDTLIREHLDANRAAFVRGRRRTQMVLLGSAAFVILTVAGIYFVAVMRSRSQPIETETTEPSRSGENTNNSEEAGVAPWVPAELLVTLATTGNRDASIAAILAPLTSASAATRAQTYPQLLTALRRSARRDAMLAELTPAIESLLLLEPDPAAQESLCQTLINELPAPGTPLPPTNEDFEMAYWGARRLASAQATLEPGTPQRRAIDSVLRSRLSSSITSESTAQVDGQVTAKLYAYLESVASDRPLEVVTLEQTLAKRAASTVSAMELARLRMSILVAVSSKVQGNSAAAKQLAITLTESADTITLLELARLRDEAIDVELRTAWGEVLVRRAGLATTPPDRELSAAVRKQLTASVVERSAASGDHTTAIKLLAEDALRNLPEPGAYRSENDVAADIEKIAAINSLLLAVAAGPAGKPLASQWLEELSVSRAETAPDIFASPLPPPRAGEMSAGDKRTFERFFTQLEDYRKLPTPQRTSILRGIAQLAPQTEDLSSRQATILVQYLTDEKSTDEHVATLEPLGALRRFRALRLQLADKLETTPADKLVVAPSILEEVVGLLIGPQADTFRWSHEAAAMALKQAVVDDLVAQSSSTASQVTTHVIQLSLDHLEERLTSEYRRRATLAGVPSSISERATSPGQVLPLLLEAQLSAPGRSSSPADAALRKELDTAEFLATSDLELTLLASNVWLAKVALDAERDLPTKRDSLETLRAARQRSPMPTTILDQLLASESAAGEILLLYLP